MVGFILYELMVMMMIITTLLIIPPVDDYDIELNLSGQVFNYVEKNLLQIKTFSYLPLD